jgi:hypothetical protein
MSTQTIFRTVGSTSQSTDISLVQNAASTAPGDPILGLAFNTANLVAYYRINGTGTLTAIVLATQTQTGAYSSGGFVKIDDVHAPGQYRFDIPNAVLASAGEVNITFSGIPAGTSGNMETHTVKVIVTALDFYTVGGALLTTQMTESYPAINTAPTLAQSLFLMMQRGAPTSRAVVGTTETILKLDGVTTAATFTLNNSSNPTSVVRAT